MTELEQLAKAIPHLNSASAHVASIIGRPAERGHIGEFIASRVFNIRLHTSATERGSDGFFIDGPHLGKNVNIKFYGKREGILDIRSDAVPDLFLVMTGPKSTSSSSSGSVRPICIEYVFLIPGNEAICSAESRNVMIREATSFPGSFWDEHEVYPASRSKELNLTQDQIRSLELFSFKPS